MTGRYVIVQDGKWWLVVSGIKVMGRYASKSEAMAAIEAGQF